MSEKWDRRFLDLASNINGWSNDNSTKVGCVVVGEDREIRSTWMSIIFAEELRTRWKD